MTTVAMTFRSLATGRTIMCFRGYPPVCPTPCDVCFQYDRCVDQHPSKSEGRARDHDCLSQRHHGV